MFENWKDKEFIKKETVSEAIIRFQDCDPLRHLNNAKYFDYFYNSREDQIAKLYNFRLNELFEEFGCSWVVYNHNISYIKPAVMGEWVKIFSRIISYDSKTTVVEYIMTDQYKRNLRAILLSTMKYVNVETGKTTTHQEEIMTFLDAVHWKSRTEHDDSLDIKNRLDLAKKQLNP
jgi:YbgC/YbaW family acyl-CoA thioester hydrolase